jgi:hypothetical protein
MYKEPDGRFFHPIANPLLLSPAGELQTAIHEYEPNTWGPPEADWIMEGDGGWYNPKPEEVIG